MSSITCFKRFGANRLSKLTYFNFSLDVKSYLEFRKQYVCIDNVKSTFMDIPVGVPQGSILRPLLFSKFINDLPNSCNNVEFQLYADDAVIFTGARSIQESTSVLTSAVAPVNECFLTLVVKNCIAMCEHENFVHRSLKCILL